MRNATLMRNASGAACLVKPDMEQQPLTEIGSDSSDDIPLSLVATRHAKLPCLTELESDVNSYLSAMKVEDNYLIILLWNNWVHQVLTGRVIDW